MIRKSFKSAIKNLSNSFCATRSYGSMRNISSKLDQLSSEIVKRLKGASIPRILVASNIAGYSLYFILGNQNFLNTLSNPIWANVVNRGFFQFVINSGLLYVLSTQIQNIYGPVALVKILLVAITHGIIFGGIAKLRGVTPNYWGNDAMIQSMLFTILLRNPTSKMIFAPIMIPVRCWVIAVVVALCDLFSLNVFGWRLLLTKHTHDTFLKRLSVLY